MFMCDLTCSAQAEMRELFAVCIIRSQLLLDSKVCTDLLSSEKYVIEDSIVMEINY